jgi:flagellar protein FliO/FliZ
MIKSILLPRAVAPVTAVLGACLLAFACPASAFSPPLKTGGESTPIDLDQSTSASHSTSSGGASIVRTIVGLAIVIAVIWGLAWILRQVKAGRDPHVSSAGLSSVAALTLSSGRSLHLVRAGRDYVLLGSGEHGLVPIHRYTEEQAREAGLLGDPQAFVEQPPERSRLAVAASQLVAGTGRVIGPGQRYGQRYGQRELPIEGGRYDHGAILAPGELPDSPAAAGWGSRSDPMRMPSPSSGLIERLREMTVRR